MLAAGLLAAALGFWAPPARAVTFLDQAERLQRVYAYLLDYRPVQAPLIGRPGSWEAALNFTPMPSIDNRVGESEGPVDPPATVPRPRFRFFRFARLGWGFTVTPPVEVEGYTAALAGLEGFLRLPLGPVRVGLRAYLLSGQVEGPITSATQPDRFSFSNQGTDLLIGWAGDGWTPYLGRGTGNATTKLEITSDGARLQSDGGFTYWVAGVTWSGKRFSATVEQSSTGDFLRHFTVAFSLFL